jgi:hypothetical protein
MKNILYLILCLVPACGFGQSEPPLPDTVTWYQPYLLDDGRVIGLNTALKNRDLNETDVDTIFYKIELSYPASISPVHVRIEGDTSLQYEVVLAMSAYAIWQRNSDPRIGNHWHLYDALRRPIEFIIAKGATIFKIVQTGTKKRT